jgi:hypothetical protein
MIGVGRVPHSCVVCKGAVLTFSMSTQSDDEPARHAARDFFTEVQLAGRVPYPSGLCKVGLLPRFSAFIRHIHTNLQKATFMDG